MSVATQVLIVDDEPELLRYMQTLLSLDGHLVTTATSGSDALELVKQGFSPNLVFLDLLMPGFDGLETLQQLKQIRPRTDVIMLSCVGDTRKVVQAMRLGAQDYLTKPFLKSELESAIDRCLGRSQNSSWTNSLKTMDSATLQDIGEGRLMVAASPAMRKVCSFCEFVAKVDMPVLILGESGTGKEVVARLIHKLSPRSDRPFLKINCAAMPGDLLESELFGYEPGAFTGATHSKPGKFEMCNRGTILLDEIGEMPAALQAKLLHVLQDGQFSRLGGRTVIQADVRVLAATNIDIKEGLASRRLREDLYYRLNTFVVRMPALRERKEEIPILIKHFMTHFAERCGTPPLPLTPPLLASCTKYHWPGNIRELENFVKRWLVLRDEVSAMAEVTIGSDALVSGLTPRFEQNSQQARTNLKSVARSAIGVAETEAIAKALAQTNWNRKRAAELLNISYKALLYKIRQYELGEHPLSRAS